MSHLRKLPMLAMLLAVAGVLGACDDTLQGFGEDVEDAGEGIEEAGE
jgi:predicted small secreted protein